MSAGGFFPPAFPRNLFHGERKLLSGGDGHGHDLPFREFQDLRRHLGGVGGKRLLEAQGLVAQVGEALGRLHRREQVETLDPLEAVLDVVARKGVQDVLREFVGIGGGEHDDGGMVLFVPLFAVEISRVHRHARVRVHRITVLFEHVVHRLHRLVFAGAHGVKIFGERFPFRRRDLIPAPVGQRFHARSGEAGVPARDLEEKPFEIGGDENVHGGGHRAVEVAVGVVRPRFEELGEHFVAVGGAEQLPHGQPHLLGVPARENVPEIAGGDGEIDGRARFDLRRGHEIGVGGKIIDDLGHQPPEIDGIGARKPHPPLSEFGVEGLGKEEGFDGALAVVEIPLHARGIDVVSVLRAHLQALHAGHPFVGEEHRRLGAGNVAEAFQRRLARVPAGGGENEDLPFRPRQFRRPFEEAGKQGERDVLEGAGGAAEEFQNVQSLADADEGSGVGVVEGGVCRRARLFEKVGAEIAEIFPDDEGGAFGVVHAGKGGYLLRRDGGKGFGDEKPPVRSQPSDDRLRRRRFFHTSRADEIHKSYLSISFFRSRRGKCKS